MAFLALHWLDLVVIAMGLVFGGGTYAKPHFFWQSARLRKTREILGEQGTVLFYYGLAGLMIFVGGWGLLR